MKHLITNPRDFWSGVMFAVLGSAFAGIAFTYKIGTAARMGPGYFPFFLGLILAGIGVAIVFASLKTQGPKVDKFNWVPLFWVLGSICLFGVLLKLTGVLVAGFGLVVGASYGGPEHKLRDSVLLALALTVFCAAVFVGGLKLPIPMCPGFEFFEQFSLCRV